MAESSDRVLTPDDASYATGTAIGPLEDA